MCYFDYIVNGSGLIVNVSMYYHEFMTASFDSFANDYRVTMRASISFPVRASKSVSGFVGSLHYTAYLRKRLWSI
jgi:hypothetical protein